MNKYTLLLILPVFLGMISCKKQGPSGPEPLVLEPGQLKVMSFNIRSVTNESEALNNWCMRGQACRMVVEYEQPSIVGFQELAEEQWAYMKGTLAGKGYAGVGDDRDCRNSCLYRPTFWNWEITVCSGCLIRRKYLPTAGTDMCGHVNGPSSQLRLPGRYSFL